jgi:hypothetical protein
MLPEIRISYSKRKSGVTVRAFEAYASERYGTTKAGFYVASDDTLPEAMGRIMARIKSEWSHARELPRIVDCGRVSDLMGSNWRF